MAWSAQFTTALAMQSRNPVYRLLVHGGYGSTGFRLGSTPPGRALTIASAPGYAPPSASGSALLLIGQRIRVQGTRVGPITWRVSIGQWAVELVGDISTFRKHCPRGAICSLEMGFVGWDVSKFQCIAVGRFQACTSTGLERGVQHMATFSDAGAMLQTRIPDTYTEVELFHSAGGGGALTANYTPGDAVITVSGIANFYRQNSGVGVVKVTPTTGEPFYLKWDGVSGSDLQLNPSGSDVFNTAQTAAVIGDSVSSVAYLYGHPLDILRKLLVSGNGGGSVWDLLPDPWSIRLPQELVDTSNIEVWELALQAAAGAYSWEVLEEESQSNGWSWLTTLLSKAGIWPVLRQGQLTARYAQDPFSPLVHSGRTITEADLMGPWSLVDWDPSVPAEYARNDAATRLGHATGASKGLTASRNTLADSLPMSIASTPLDLSDRIYDTTAGPSMRQDAIDRMSPWAFRVPERLTLPLRLDWAQMCSGDIVDVTLPAQGRTSNTLRGYEQQPCMVAAVDADYAAGVCILELLTIEDT